MKTKITLKIGYILWEHPLLPLARRSRGCCLIYILEKSEIIDYCQVLVTSLFFMEGTEL
jgi:hypothetical protein